MQLLKPKFTNVKKTKNEHQYIVGSYIYFRILITCLENILEVVNCLRPSSNNVFTGAQVITDDAFWLTDYVMFRKNGGGMLVNAKQYIPACESQL